MTFSPGQGGQKTLRCTLPSVGLAAMIWPSLSASHPSSPENKADVPGQTKSLKKGCCHQRWAQHHCRSWSWFTKASALNYSLAKWCHVCWREILSSGLHRVLSHLREMTVWGKISWMRMHDAPHRLQALTTGEGAYPAREFNHSDVLLTFHSRTSMFLGPLNMHKMIYCTYERTYRYRSSITAPRIYARST